MADRRLAEPEPLSRACDAALLDQCVEDPQEVQIKRVKMHIMHMCDAQLSLVCKMQSLHRPLDDPLNDWSVRYVELVQIDYAEFRITGGSRGGCAGAVGLIAAAE